MKKLSTILAAAALAVVACDPYEDAPGGDPQVVQVTAAGLEVDPVTVDEPDANGWFVLTDVPVGSGNNNVIIVTTNKLLDGATIQTAPQDFTDATSTGDCTPANDWLTIRKDAGSGFVDEPLTYADPGGGSAFQWYTCYYPSSATNRLGASIEIFRARIDTPPNLLPDSSPLDIARLEPGVTYEFTGEVADESGNPLTIQVRVTTAP